MGLRDILRRKHADAENQGDDFVEDDSYVSPVEQNKAPDEVKQDAANNKAQ